MKLNKDEMKRVLGGGNIAPPCRAYCWDGSYVEIVCDWTACKIYPGSHVTCHGARSQECPPFN